MGGGLLRKKWPHEGDDDVCCVEDSDSSVRESNGKRAGSKRELTKGEPLGRRPEGK